VCGKEADRYLKATLDDFKRLCDDVVICLNNASQAEKDMIDSYGFYWYEDNREWGRNQHIIKQDLLDNYVKELNPDWCVCLDMDETFANLTRERIESLESIADSLYVFIVNLWDDGWCQEWSFWNIRVWKWTGETKIKHQPLHCGLGPEWTYHMGVYSPIVLLHRGLQKAEDRQKKIERYEKYDSKAIYKDKSFYLGLKNSKSAPFDEKKIVDIIEKEWIEKNRPPSKKRMQIFQKKEEIVMMRTKEGRLIDVPLRHVAMNIKEGSIVLKDEPKQEVKEETKEPNKEPIKLSCSQCDFTAKSEFGLKVHSRKHV